MSRALPNARWTFRSVCTMEDYGLWRVNGPVVAPAKARGRVRLLLINLVGIERLVGIGEHELRAAVLALHRAVEAGVPSGVAGAAGLLDANPHRVLIAIHPHLDNALDMTRRLTFAPQLLARAAEVPGVAGLDGPAQRLIVHVGDHQHVARAGVGRHAGHKPGRVEARSERKPLFKLCVVA